ncbi:MAG: FHA domain-containing protein [Blastocatellia bacterium]|nr:FHA domain-containing protein [Blastocatellia bacterium]
MSNLEPTRRIERLILDTDESNCATLIILFNQKIVKSVGVDSLITIIGRDPKCAIPLESDTEISRQHARIRIGLTPDGTKQYLLSDLGSTNGTFLNGKRLDPNQEMLLSDGDTFDIGQHLFKFAILDHSNEKFMTGSLSQISLFDLIQVIENNRLTCILVIRSQTMVARLYLNDGLIVDCDLDIKPEAGKVIDYGVESLRGLDAFRKLATIQEGLFEVEKYEFHFPVNIQTSTNTNLVLDTLREIDEANAGIEN